MTSSTPFGPSTVILLGVRPPPGGQTNDFPLWGRRVVILARVIDLVLVVLLVVTGGTDSLIVPMLALIGLAVVMSLPLRPAWSAVSPMVEGALAAAVVASVPSLPDSLLLYLIVPPLAAGLLRGFRATLITSGVTALSFVIVRGLAGTLGTVGDRSALIQWIGLGLATGLVGAWGRWSTLRASQAGDDYVEANRLLTQLRDLARTLPTGFDEIGIASTLLSDLRTEVGADVAIVSTLTDGGRLAPLAELGADRAMWGAGAPEGAWADALQRGEPVAVDGQLDGRAGFTLVLPLRLGDRRTGAAALSRASSAYSVDEIASAARLVDDTALRLDTGRLFSDVRAWATVEERRRLSREIHDGIAQELVGLGFVIDDLVARSSDAESRAELVDLRAEVTRMVSELRLSIFDLRSQIEPTAGLGTALGDYVRQVGAMSGLTVHLVLNEDVRRLPVETEAELLRIAQEAIANARRHAQARNLWVTARVDPPHALLRVADDGIGLGTPRHDSYGLDIMHERAERIGATLDFRTRVGGGTIVEVNLGDPAESALQSLERGTT